MARRKNASGIKKHANSVPAGQKFGREAFDFSDHLWDLFNALTGIQQHFSIGVLACKTGTDAYWDSGAKVKTRDAARSASARLLANDNVKAFIEAVKREWGQAAASESMSVRDRIVGKLEVEASGDFSSVLEIRDVPQYDDEGGIVGTEKRVVIKEDLDLTNLPICSEVVTRNGRAEIKISPMSSANLLADLEGMKKAKKVEVKKIDLSLLDEMSEEEIMQAYQDAKG